MPERARWARRGREEASRQEEATSWLARLGLGDDGAQVYVELCRLGPSRAADLAQSLRFSRPRVYRALDSLAHSGFVHLGMGRPRPYSAAPPTTVFAALRDRAERLAVDVQKAELDLLGDLRRLGDRAGEGPRAPLFTVVRGMDAVVSQAHGLYAEARSRIDLLFTHQGGRELFRAVDETSLLARRARQGVDVRLLVRSAPASPTAWAVSEQLPNVAIRVVDTDAISTFVLIDDREALVIVNADPAARREPELDMAFRTNASQFVAMQAILFERLWQSGKPLPRPGPARRRKGASMDARERSN